MTIIYKLKENINTKLDAWEAKASAMEAQLELTRAQALDRLEEKKLQFRSNLDKVEEKIYQLRSVTDTKKADVITAIDNLKFQLAFAKADSKYVYYKQKQAIENAIATFENRVNQVFDERISRAAEKLSKESDELRAELEAAQIQFTEKKSELHSKFEDRRAALQSRIHSFKDELNATRRLSKDKAAEFDSELSYGLQRIRDAFHHLFS